MWKLAVNVGGVSSLTTPVLCMEADFYHWEPEHIASASLSSQLAPGIPCLCIVSSGIAGGPPCVPGIAFIWVLGSSTRVLTLAQQAL